MKKIFLILAVFAFLSIDANAQGGMKFAELAKRLEHYFNKEMILDIQNEFPQGSDYSIWGWDVGDFSGDGIIDAAFSVRVASQKGRTMQVYLFVDIDGYFVKAGQFAYEFVEIPLEIGVVIKDNACYITKKNKMFDWLIRGYRFDGGALVLLDEFSTKRTGGLTNESYRNFETLNNTERYLNTHSGIERFSAEYMAIPSYSRGRLIYKGYQSESFVDNINFVPKGAFHWFGNEDLSFSASSAYDDDFLYMTIRVQDDVIVPQTCDTCFSDYIEVWFDMNPLNSKPDRFVKSVDDNSIVFNDNVESGLFCLTIYPGNFMDRPATVKLSTTDDLEPYQKIASMNIAAVADLHDNTYLIRFRVPFALFGLQGNPVESGKIIEYGCTITVHDFDNEFRPEEYTKKNSSVFDPKKPSSYGTIILIPDNKWYGSALNIYQDDILKSLLEYGF